MKLKGQLSKKSKKSIGHLVAVNYYSNKVNHKLNCWKHCFQKDRLLKERPAKEWESFNHYFKCPDKCWNRRIIIIIIIIIMREKKQKESWCFIYLYFYIYQCSYLFYFLTISIFLCLLLLLSLEVRKAAQLWFKWVIKKFFAQVKKWFSVEVKLRYFFLLIIVNIIINDLWTR